MRSLLLPVGLIVCLAATMLATTFILQSRGGKDYDKLHETLLELQQIDSEINSEVLRLQFNSRSNYDALTELEREFVRRLGALDNLAAIAFRPGQERYDRDALIEPFVTKTVLISDFKALHAILRNSVSIFRSVGMQLGTSLSDDSKSLVLATPLLKLEKAALDMVLSSGSSSASSLQEAIDDMERATDTTDLSNSNLMIQRCRILLAHARNIQTVKPDIDLVLHTLDQLPVNSALTRLSENGERIHELDIRGAARFQTAQLLTMLLLIGGGVALLQRVRRRVQSVRKMRDALERQYEVRTEELQVMELESTRCLNSIRSAVIRLDAVGQVLRWNASASRHFRVSETEAVGRAFYDLPIRWEDGVGIAVLLDEASGTASRHGENRILFAEELSTYVSIAVHPISAGTTHLGLLIVVEDISEHRLLEFQLEQSQKLQSVGQLAAGVAHEINTPMQYIGDNVQFLKSSLGELQPALELALRRSASIERDQDIEHQILEMLESLNLEKMLQRVPKALEDAEQGVSHVSRIVHAMQEFSQLGFQQPTLLDLNRLIESTVVVSRSEWRFVSEMEFDLNVALPMISGYAGELQQALLSLIANAAQAVADPGPHRLGHKGVIRISTAMEDAACVISVSDNGCGIAPEMQPEILTASLDARHSEKGSRKGLAIAYQAIVQKHAGELWFASQAGQGTTFFVRLPLVAPCSLPA